MDLKIVRLAMRRMLITSKPKPAIPKKIRPKLSHRKRK